MMLVLFILPSYLCLSVCPLRSKVKVCGQHLCLSVQAYIIKNRRSQNVLIIVHFVTFPIQGQGQKSRSLCLTTKCVVTAEQMDIRSPKLVEVLITLHDCGCCL